MRTQNILLFTSMLLFGCATASTSTGQSVYIQTVLDNKLAQDINCTLSNGAGKWQTASFKSIEIKRAWGDLVVHCTNSDNTYEGNEVIRSVANSSLWASALLGPVGLAVDSASATGVDYPNNIIIFLKKTDLTTR